MDHLPTSGPGSEASQAPLASLADQAYERLETMIVAGNLAPGSAVTEAGLVAATGWGRMPIREALQRLGREGLVSIRPRSGARIAEMDLGQILLILEARRPLDRVLATAAAARATPYERERFQLVADALRGAARAEDLPGFLAADRQFDKLVEQAARNPFATQAAAPLHIHGRRFWYLHRHALDLARSAKAHGAVADALAAGDEAQAAKASDALMDYLERLATQVVAGTESVEARALEAMRGWKYGVE